MDNIISVIKTLAGVQRGETFAKAAKFVLSCGPKPIIIETGCYRGNPADGNSTLILAMLAKETDGMFSSYELHEHNIKTAWDYLKKNQLDEAATFVIGDCRTTLIVAPKEIQLAYLDSYDFEEHKAIDAQAHQLVEVGILLPKMAKTSAFLLDDCNLPLGGKAGLSVAPILACGYKEMATGYQRLFIRQ